MVHQGIIVLVFGMNAEIISSISDCSMDKSVYLSIKWYG